MFLSASTFIFAHWPSPLLIHGKDSGISIEVFCVLEQSSTLSSDHRIARVKRAVEPAKVTVVRGWQSDVSQF